MLDSQASAGEDFDEARDERERADASSRCCCRLVHSPRGMRVSKSIFIHRFMELKLALTRCGEAVSHTWL